MPLERALSADEGSSRMSAAMRSTGADLTRSGHCADILQNLRILCVWTWTSLYRMILICSLDADGRSVACAFADSCSRGRILIRE